MSHSNAMFIARFGTRSAPRRPRGACDAHECLTSRKAYECDIGSNRCGRQIPLAGNVLAAESGPGKRSEDPDVGKSHKEPLHHVVGHHWGPQQITETEPVMADQVRLDHMQLRHRIQYLYDDRQPRSG